jgi:maltose O-acetyltransferase
MHPLRAAERRTPDAEVAAGSAAWRTMTAPVSIGDDVWLGAGVLVLPGVTVGDRSVVAAGAVVSEDVPADSLAVGIPARIVRSLA